MKKFYIVLSVAAAMLTMSSNAVSAEGNKIVLDLANPANPESFDFDDKGVWTGTYSEDYMYWESQVFMFSHILGGSSWGGSYWDGFTVSRNSDNTDHAADGWLTYQWGCMAGGGITNVDETTGEVSVSADRPYILGYWSGFPEDCCTILFNDGNSYSPAGVYISLSPYAYYANIKGASPASPMQNEGDFLSITATAVDADGGKTSVTKILAEYRNGKLEQSDKWEWFDLSSLGKAEQIIFTMDSSDKSYGYMNTPAYFCLDRLTVTTDDLSGVEESKAVSSEFKIYAAGGTLNIEAPTAAVAAIYSMSGTQVRTAQVAEGYNTVQIADLPAGVYIVKCAGETTRIIKK